MPNYEINLQPNLVNLGTEGSLDTSILNGKSIQRTVHGLDVVNGENRKIVGRLSDGDVFDNVVENACDLSGLKCEGGSLWGLFFSKDSETSSTFYSQSADADNEGNIFYFSTNIDSTSNSTSVVRKISPDGSIIWQNNQACGESNNDFAGKEPSRLRVASDGGVFLIYERAIRKIDTNGDVEWTFIQDSGYSTVNYFANCAEDSSGNLFVSGYGSYEGNQYFIVKFNSNGEPIKEIFVDAAEEDYMAADMVIDSNDNVIIPMNHSLSDGAWSTTIAKFPNDLSGSNPTWFTTLSAEYGYGADQDSYAMGIDSNDNIYVLGYGYAVTKINSSGEIQWARGIDGQGMAVDADGNCYVVEDATDKLQVTKISTDGDLEWSYEIEKVNEPWDDFYIAGYQDNVNSGVQLKNGVLVVLVRAEISGETFEFVMKLSLDPISGTFGDFSFTDITSEMVFDILSVTNNNANDAVSIYEGDVVSNVTETFDEPNITQIDTITNFE